MNYLPNEDDLLWISLDNNFNLNEILCIWSCFVANDINLQEYISQITAEEYYIGKREARGSEKEWKTEFPEVVRLKSSKF